MPGKGRQAEGARDLAVLLVVPTPCPQAAHQLEFEGDGEQERPEEASL